MSTSAISFRCIRCGTSYPADRDYFGCPSCAAEGIAVNLEVDYAEPLRIDPGEWEHRPRGLWRYDSALPLRSDDAVTLGEGATPLVACETLGAGMGLPRLLAKNESQNPTWSFKDRLGSLAISWARALGRRGVAVSSSGNAGATAAAYAARAGMPCIVFTTRSFPGPMLRFMRSFGALVVAAPSAPERWTLNRLVSDQWGFLPVSNLSNPPLGSHPVAIEGCKTIAYELVEDLGGAAPDVVIIPVAYGDSISGIYRGFRDLVEAGVLERLPRLVAAEAYPSLSTALRENAGAPARRRGLRIAGVLGRDPAGHLPGAARDPRAPAAPPSPSRTRRSTARAPSSASARGCSSSSARRCRSRPHASSLQRGSSRATSASSP